MYIRNPICITNGNLGDANDITNGEKIALIAFFVISFFCEYHFKNLERNNLHAAPVCVCPYMYHSVVVTDDVYIYLYNTVLPL